MKLMHLCLCGPYSDDYEYQDNILPQKHFELGFEVRVLVPQDTWESGGKLGKRPAKLYTNDAGYQIQIIPYKNTRNAEKYRLFNGLYEAISDFSPDILFCHGGLTYSYNAILRYLNEKPTTRFFMDSHIDENISGILSQNGINKLKRILLYKFVWGHCVRVLSKRAIRVWGVTPARVDFLNRVYMVPKNKIDLLVMGADENKIDFSRKSACEIQLRNICGIDEKTLLIVTGGKLDAYKNIPALLAAMKEIEEYDIHLAVFGAASDDMQVTIENLAKETNNVTMLGWANSDQITEYFLGADVAIFPGRHSVLWEKAVACGLPCIIKRADGMQHVDVGGNCVFYDGDTSDNIKRQIIDLYENKERLTEMSNVAREKGIKSFSYINIARRAILMEE